jgi:hypothetical protein
MSTLLAQNTVNFRDAALSVDLPGSEKGGDFGSFMGGLMSGIMVVAALLAFLFFIWGAIEWITSGGDKSKLESARNKISQALVGLIVLAATTAIFILLQRFLDICVLNFGGTC